MSGCRSAEKGDYSTLQPECFAEVLLRIYTKKPEYWGRVQAGYRRILDSLSVEGMMTMTPPSLRLMEEEEVVPSTPPVRATRDEGGSVDNTKVQFLNNSFTTVSPWYSMSKSPLRGGATKRVREAQISQSPTRKRNRS